jgi:hypothetical protein
MVGFLSTSFTLCLLIRINTALSLIKHSLHFTVAHALGFSVFTISLLAKDLNKETSTSNHYEVFLLFRLQSLWNLRTLGLLCYSFH